MGINPELLSLVNKEFGSKAQISRISEDLRGKVLVIYGGNNLGKTKQASRFKNPIFLPVEKGMNAINGALVLKTSNWAELKANGRKLASPKFTNLLKSGEQITVVIDGIERIGTYAKNLLCKKYEVSSIGKANGGFGAWEEYDAMVWTFVDDLISLGYTVVFIGHEKYDRKKDKFVIDGDERNVKPIRDNADIVVYCKSNGVDQDGNEIPSSCYLAETDDYFARCRFTEVATKIEEFTAENLEREIVEGIKRQNKLEGFDSVNFEEQQGIYNSEPESLENVKGDIKKMYDIIADLPEEYQERYVEITEDYLDGISVGKATKKHLELLISIREELDAVLEEAKEAGEDINLNDEEEDN